jgi:phage shock protein C
MSSSLLNKTPRLSNQKMILGVIAGLAEYLTIDVTVARLLYATITIATGVFPGVVLYIVAYLILKNNGASESPSDSPSSDLM